MALKSDYHYHAQDIIKRLNAAKEKGLPVYPAQGPCGGCDIVIQIKEDPMDIDKLIKSLSKVAEANAPLYPAEGPCGGCDLVL